MQGLVLRMEEKVENKVIVQPGNPSKPTPALEKPLVKLPTTRQASLKSNNHRNSSAKDGRTCEEGTSHPFTRHYFI